MAKKTTATATQTNPTATIAIKFSDSLWKELSTLYVDGEPQERMVSVQDIAEHFNDEITVVKVKMKDGTDHKFIKWADSDTLTEIADEYDVGAVLNLIVADKDALASKLMCGAIVIA